MSKKKRRADRSTAGDGQAASPFAALADLREALPPGEAEASTDDDAKAGEPSAAAAPAFAGKLVVRKERKGHGGKTVTVVQGLPDDDALLAELKRALGTGARREGDDVVVQGDVCERVRDWLVARGAKRVVVGT